MKRLIVLMCVLFLSVEPVSIQAAKSYPTTAGLHKDLTFKHAGQQRTFNLLIPALYSSESQAKFPMMLLLHGGGGSANLMSSNSMADVARAKGIILVIPNGSGFNNQFYWNHGLPLEIPDKPDISSVDDVGFLRDLAEELKKQLRVDSSRVYVAGISEGGMMTHRLAVELPDMLAAAAPLAGLSQVRASKNAPLKTIGVPRGPIPMVLVQGTADPIVPYVGGRGKVNPDSANIVGSFADTIRFWLEGNGGTTYLPSSTRMSSKGYLISTFDSGEAPVIAVTIINGTHEWCKSETMSSLAVSELTWEQLSKFKKAKRTTASADGGM